MTALLRLYQIADQEGIQVDCFDLEKREALSIRDRSGDCYIAINPLKLISTKDETVKLGHELGHCMTGSFYNEKASCDVRQKHENRADKWEIEQLVPKDELDKAIGKKIVEIWELAEYFNVTEDFMRKAICWYKNGNLAVDWYC